jgi:endonuclease/exonuclease/phosphatase family metal-dependent hydrolase
MSVYDIDGNALETVYGIDGEVLAKAYDIDGNEIFPDTPESNTITVMTFNVGSFYTEWHPAPSDTGDVFYLRNKGIFNNSAPIAFAGLSEWYNQIGTVPARTLMDEFFNVYYPNYTPYPSSANHALTSAFSKPASDVVLVPYQTQGSEMRYYQKSYATYGGKRICFILTHLDLNLEKRSAQFLELMSAVQNEPHFVIVGDFNFTITAVGDAQYNASIKVALDNGYHSAQNASNLYMTWYSGETVKSSERILPLDNIITSSNITISNVRRDTTKLTDGICSEYGIIIDHLPLIADLTIS